MFEKTYALESDETMKKLSIFNIYFSQSLKMFGNPIELYICSHESSKIFSFRLSHRFDNIFTLVHTTIKIGVVQANEKSSVYFMIGESS